MRHQQGENSHDRLLDWLRSHDPGGEPPLDAAERTRLRRRMLAGVSPRRGWVDARWWAWGGALAALAAAVILGHLGVSSDRERQAEPKPTATMEVQARQEPRQQEREAASPGPTLTAEMEAGTPTRHMDTESLRDPVVSASPAPLPPSRHPPRGPRRALELRFVAPNGTRIVWALDPELDLADARPTKRGS